MAMGSTNDRFVRYVRNHLKEYGFKLYLGKGKEVNSKEGWRSSGFFCLESRVIAVGTGAPQFIETLVHEYAHFLQWLDSTNSLLEREDTAARHVSDYLHGNKGKLNLTLRKSFQKVMEFERDAEMRAVKCIVTHKLNIPIEMYIKRANLYIYSHYLYMLLRKYSWKKNPNKSCKVIAEMPNNFRTKAHKSCPLKIYKLLQTYW